MSRSGTVRANGQELYYEVHGEGQPLILVMGIGYDSTLWTLAQVPALSKKFQVVIFDNRDAGRSSQATSIYTIADMADDTAALMDALDIKKAHVCGLSMGGMIVRVRAPSPWSPGSDDPDWRARGARSRGLPSGHDLELG